MKYIIWSNLASQIDFTTSMADAASTIVDYFKNKGGISYINVLVNISKSCDCAGSSAPTPKIRNIGILSSLDPVAIDKACYDLIVKENNDGSKDWVRQAETKLGLNTLDKAVEHGIGSLEYNLIDIDEGAQPIPSSDSTQPQEPLDSQKNDDILLYRLVPIFCIIVLGIIIFLIYTVIKRKKSQNLMKNEDIGQVIPEDIK